MPGESAFIASLTSETIASELGFVTCSTSGSVSSERLSFFFIFSRSWSIVWVAEFIASTYSPNSFWIDSSVSTFLFSSLLDSVLSFCSVVLSELSFSELFVSADSLLVLFSSEVSSNGVLE